MITGALSDGREEGQELEIVVYGVGSISGSETSRCQLAFVLLLKKLLQVGFQLECHQSGEVIVLLIDID